MKSLYLLIIYALLLITQGKDKVYVNKDFRVVYSVNLIKEVKIIKGRITKNRSNDPISNINIWYEIKGENNGTVPNHKGYFTFVVPKNCKKIHLLKHPFKQFTIKLEE